MNTKIAGTLLGVAGVVLWFMPLIELSWMGRAAYQTGQHIGGIAWLLLFSSFAYAVLSWLEQHVPRIIAASVALAISLLILAQAGEAAASGLLSLITVSLAGIALAVYDMRRSPA